MFISRSVVRQEPECEEGKSWDEVNKRSYPNALHADEEGEGVKNTGRRKWWEPHIKVETKGVNLGSRDYVIKR
jgi:hypothetical protein